MHKMRTRRFYLAALTALAAALLIGLAACGSAGSPAGLLAALAPPTVTPTPTATATATPTLTPTATATPTLTPSPTPTSSPTPTATPTASPTPSASPLPTSLPPAPNRIVAPAIHLDTKVITVGWHEVKTAKGIVEEWDVANFAAGWHQNSARPGEVGNMVLSGHHNMAGEVFRYVVNLKVGDAITVYAGGKAYHYRVSEKMILADKYVSQTQREANGRWIGPFADERLTLVTCWPYTNNTHRVIVIAKPAQ
jgi:sortase A